MKATDNKIFAVRYTPGNDIDKYVGSVSDYKDGGFADPILMTEAEAEELLAELQDYVKTERIGKNDWENEVAHHAYEKGMWGFSIEEMPTPEEEEKSLREQAIESIENEDDDFFRDIVLKGHETNSHKWLQCYPDGSISETEEADNNTRHYINYPDTEVANIYDIARESCESCGCDTCIAYRDFNEIEKDEFVEKWDEDTWDYCHDTRYEDALVDDFYNAGGSFGDIKADIIDAIKAIKNGYFDDEK